MTRPRRWRLLAICSILLWPSLAGAQVIGSANVTAISTGACNDGACAAFQLGGAPSVSLLVSNTFVGTLTFEITVDGVTWSTISGTLASDGTLASTMTTTGTVGFSNLGYLQIRARATAWTSGTATVTAARGVASARGGGGTGAPDDAAYVTQSTNATLTGEFSLGSLTTGLLLNTVAGAVGTPSAYGGTSCTNQFPRSLNASGAATCATVVLADTSGIAGSGANSTITSMSGLTGAITTPTSIDLENADTSLARSSAGNVSIEGNVVYRVGGTDVALADGGTAASLTASNGGIFYSTASAGAILAGTATAAQMLQSGSSTTPAWSTATWPATTTVSQLLYSSATNTVAGLTTANSGLLITSGAGVPSIGTDIPTAVTIGSAYIYRASGTDVPLADGGTGASLADPGADRIVFWDDSETATAFLTMGNSLAITTTTLDTIQDIRTSASPQFTGVGIGAAAFGQGLYVTGTTLSTYAGVTAIAAFKGNQGGVNSNVIIDSTAGNLDSYLWFANGGVDQWVIGSIGSAGDVFRLVECTADNCASFVQRLAVDPGGVLHLGTGAGVTFADDGDGALTITGEGNGSDEDLTLNFDDTANTIVASSSTGVTKIDFGTIILEAAFSSGDGSAGITQTCAATVTAVTVKDGLITAITCP